MLFSNSIKTQREDTISLQLQLQEYQTALYQAARSSERISPQDIATLLTSSIALPPNFSHAQFVEKIRSFGLSKPCSEVYRMIDRFDELPYVLFLICVNTALNSR